MPYKILDLFSGAGGLTEGFRDENFDVLGHVEKEEAASKTLQLRDAYYYLKTENKLESYFQFLAGEITEAELFELIPQKVLDNTLNVEINDSTINTIFEKFDSEVDGEHISGVIGGPPCQAYSTIGRARNSHKKATDGRIYLYRYYIDFLNHYRPDFFVFENVRGLLSFKDSDEQLLFPKMKQEFQTAGYNLDYQVVNTADYGIPQKRERVIIFGTKKKNSNLISNFFKKLNHQKEEQVTLKQALEDLPFLHSGQEVDDYSKAPNDYVQKNFRANPNVPLTQNVSRPNNNNDLIIYKKVVRAKNKGINLKYNDLPSELITHKHIDRFLDRYKSLSWDNPSHTVVAHIAKDGHHYIHPDIKQNRSITVREAARIQGFPDDFYFESSRTQAFTQIGNAVPPILSRKIATAIQELNI